MLFNHLPFRTKSIPTLRTSMTQWTGLCAVIKHQHVCINIRMFICTEQARISERKANEKQGTIIYQLKKNLIILTNNFFLCCSVMSLLSSLHAKKQMDKKIYVKVFSCLSVFYAYRSIEATLITSKIVYYKYRL